MQLDVLDQIYVAFVISVMVLRVALLFCRNKVYDSSMGDCLLALYSGCSDDIVVRTAADIVNVFPQSLSKTQSPELKVDSLPRL